MQLVDELSMIYTTCIMCFATFTYGHSVRYSIVMAITLLSCAVFITGYYHYLQDPAFHQVAYGLLTAAVLLRSIYVMEAEIRPSRKAKEQSLKEQAAALQKVTGNGHANGSLDKAQAEQRRQDERDIKILNSMWSMIAVGLAVFLGGFVLWNMDNKYCGNLRRWRREIGLPWGIILEGHGWWYVILCPYETENIHVNGCVLLNLLTSSSQASHDWHRSLLLHCLGHLASPLSQWATGRV